MVNGRKTRAEATIIFPLRHHLRRRALSVVACSVSEKLDGDPSGVMFVV